MKKALALILALLMLCSTMVVTSVAADPTSLDLNAFFEANGYASTYVGKALSNEDAKPVLDGVVTSGEYQATYAIGTGSRDCTDNSAGGFNTDGGNYTEYVSHDADYLYFAATYTQADMDRVFWWVIQKSNSYDYSYSDSKFNLPEDLKIGLRHTDEETYTFYSTSPEAEEAIGTEITFKMTQDANLKTYEFKISKEWLAEQIGAESAEDVRNLSWYTWCHRMGGGGRYMKHILSQGEKDALTELGFTSSQGFGRFVILDDAPETNAVETFWQEVADDCGWNVNVPYSKTAPTLDGVISNGEYTKIVTNTSADIYGYGNVVKSGDITEYFAHDEEWVYYAVSFYYEQHGVAFQWQYKPFNSFDIFNAASGDTYLHNRISWQARYNTGYADKYHYTNTDYTGSWAPKFTDASATVRAPYIDDTNEIAAEHHCASGKDAGNITVYEAKIAKSYLATASNCSTEDITVVPYFTYLTGTVEPDTSTACAVGAIYTTEQITALTNAGADKLPTAGEVGYKFIVLEPKPEVTITAEDIVTREEASVRISATNPGLRFKTDVDTAALNALVEEYGAENVKVGTLIALNAQDLTLTHETASKLDVAATIGSPFATEGENTVFAGSVSNVKEANLEKKFAARGYVAYNDGTGWTYVYSNVTAVRDIVTVVNAALADDEAGYTQAQIDVLNAIVAPLN